MREVAEGLQSFFIGFWPRVRIDHQQQGFSGVGFLAVSSTILTGHRAGSGVVCCISIVFTVASKQYKRRRCDAPPSTTNDFFLAEAQVLYKGSQRPSQPFGGWMDPNYGQTDRDASQQPLSAPSSRLQPAVSLTPAWDQPYDPRLDEGVTPSSPIDPTALQAALPLNSIFLRR
ncbi:hypothetical protein V2G26_000578 [Clonostachys chloroleuca]